MEPLWSPVVATRGNQRQLDRPSKSQKQAKTVAVGCHRLPETFHGKEGVDGSSPSEGSAKAPQNGVFCIRAGLHFPGSLGMESVLENQVLRRIPSRRLMIVSGGTRARG